MESKIYSRRLEGALEEFLKEQQILVLTGMRRVGKTTLLRKLFRGLDDANRLFVDLENRINRRLFQQDDYDAIWRELMEQGVSETSRAYLFLDEIQLVPEISSVMKYLYDHYDLKLVVSGSSSFYLKNLFPESLAGRKRIFELYPLDFREYLVFQDEISGFPEPDLSRLPGGKSEVRHERRKNFFEAYLRWGGFPEVALTNENDTKKGLLEDVLTSYVEMDVKRLTNFRKIRELEDLLLLLMRRIGSKTNIQKLSDAIGISRDTVYDYLEFLKKTYVIQVVQPFTRSPDREVSGQPKVYLIDTGLANQLGRQVARGPLIENAVFNQLRVYADDIRFYQRRGGRELDFVLDESIGIEVKETASETEVKKARDLGEELGLEQTYVVSHNYCDHEHVILTTQL